MFLIKREIRVNNMGRLYENLKSGVLSLPFAAILDRNKKIVKFGIVGTTFALLNIVLLYFFTDLLGIWYVASVVLAYLIVFFFGFIFQKLWTFKDKRVSGTARQLISFFSLNLICLALNAVLIYVMVEGLGLYYITSQVIIAFSLGITRFWVNNKFIFSAHEA